MTVYSHSSIEKQSGELHSILEYTNITNVFFVILDLFTYTHCSQITSAKIMLLMCLSTMSSMYTGDVEIKLQAFKISALEGSEWSAA
jgi:hypothetical protein